MSTTKNHDALKLAWKILLTIVVLAVIFSLGVVVGERKISFVDRVVGIKNKTPDESNIATKMSDLDEADFTPFWQAWLELDNQFVPTGTSTKDKVSAQDRVWGAIKGLADSYGDPYTTFLPPTDNEFFETEINGNFGGVGMEIGKKEGALVVITPLKNTPAERAGIKPGDVIVNIDGEPVSDLSVEDAVLKIRGEKGTSVTVTIYRQGENKTKDIKLIRDTIDIPVLETKTITKNGQKIFVLSLYSFSRNSPELFRNALEEFEKAKTDKLVIDLRGNPGGFLEAAVSMASWFLPEGKVIVTESRGNKDTDVVHRSLGYDVFNDNLKLVILLNKGSASASEILAGALHDHGKAKLVGSQSFGKGSVQVPVELTKNTMLKITIARWLTPNGQSISKTGIKPDYEVGLSEEDFKKGKDTQMDKAVEVLLNYNKK